MAFAAAMAALGVNGPEDDALDWAAVDWRAAEDNARRLRQRIFTGLLEPDAWKRARPVLRGAGRRNAPGLPGLVARPCRYARDACAASPTGEPTLDHRIPRTQTSRGGARRAVRWRSHGLEQPSQDGV
jgi:hypothetical protein